MKLRNKYRTHTCGELRAPDVGKSVTICGFFVRTKAADVFEVRDRHGSTRVVLGPRVGEAIRERVKASAPEDVVQVQGDVTQRAEPDPSVPTGEIYILPKQFLTISRADPMPPDVGPTAEFQDPEQRRRFRFLDLRRPVMQKRLAFRAKFLHELRSYFLSQDFIEIETPYLSKFSSEEPAAFFVPAAPSASFALPQSPQLYKQLLMVAGFDRYFQIARCFRNERRLTPDRQPEFTALDIEMAFVDEEDIYPVVDGALAHVWRAMLGRKLETPIRKLTYADAIRRFGTDRPDLRFELELEDVTEVARRWPVPDVQERLKDAPEGGARLIRVPQALGAFEVGWLEALPLDMAGRWNAHISWLRVETPTKFAGPLVRDQPELKVVQDIAASVDARPGDVVIVAAASHRAVASAAAGDVRVRVARALKLIDRSRHEFVWIHEFPFFEYDPVAQGYAGARHPFTQPLDEDIPHVTKDKLRVRAKAYDLVLNGVELGAGSIRNHDPEMQDKIFAMFEYPVKEVYKRFGFVLEAFKFGVPPHGGLSIGLDRLLAQLHGTDAMDEVIAFPKGPDGTDAMVDSPSPIDPGFVKQMLSA